MVRNKKVISFNNKEDYLLYSREELPARSDLYTDNYDNVVRGWTFTSTDIMKMKSNTAYTGYVDPNLGYLSIGDKITISGAFASLHGICKIELRCSDEESFPVGTAIVTVPSFKIEGLDRYLQNIEYTFIIRKSGYYRIRVGTYENSLSNETWFRNFAIEVETINSQKDYMRLDNIRKCAIQLSGTNITLINGYANDSCTFSIENDTTIILTFSKPLQSALRPLVFVQEWFSESKNYTVKVDFQYVSSIRFQLFKYGEITPTLISSIPNAKFNVIIIA